jgi:hypothetical protein
MDEPELEGPKGFRSRFFAYRAAAFNLAAGDTDLSFDTEFFDGLGEYDGVGTFRFRPRRPGYYLLIASVGWVGGGVGNLLFGLRFRFFGGADIAHTNYSEDPNASDQSFQVSTIRHLDPTDQVYVTASAPGARVGVPAASRTFFCAHRLS